MNQTIQQMPEANKKRIRSLLSTATVEYNDNAGSTQRVARRIVRVARKTGPGA